MRQNKAMRVTQARTEGQCQKDKARDRRSGGAEAEGQRESAFGEPSPCAGVPRGWKDCGAGAWLQPRERVARAEVPLCF